MTATDFDAAEKKTKGTSYRARKLCSEGPPLYPALPIDMSSKDTAGQI